MTLPYMQSDLGLNLTSQLLQRQMTSPVERLRMAATKQEMGYLQQDRRDEAVDAKNFARLMKNLEKPDPNFVFPEFRTKSYNALVFQMAMNRQRAMGIGGGRSLPAEWQFMTPEQREEYLERYSRGGREYGSKPAAWEGLSPDEVDKSKAIKAGLEPAVGRAETSERKEISDIMTLRQNLDTIENLYDDKYVGVVEGNPTYNAAKEVTGIGVDVKGTQFRRLVNDLSDRLLRARSGAQINEQEFQRLLKIVPTTNLSETAFKARLKSFKEELNRILENKKQVLVSSGLKVPDTETMSNGINNVYDEFGF